MGIFDTGRRCQSDYCEKGQTPVWQYEDGTGRLMDSGKRVECMVCLGTCRNLTDFGKELVEFLREIKHGSI